MQPTPVPGQTIYVPPTQTASGAVQPAGFMQMQTSLHGYPVAYTGGVPSLHAGTAPPMYWTRPAQSRQLPPDSVPAPVSSPSIPSTIVSSSTDSGSTAASTDGRRAESSRRTSRPRLKEAKAKEQKSMKRSKQPNKPLRTRKTHEYKLARRDPEPSSLEDAVALKSARRRNESTSSHDINVGSPFRQPKLAGQRKEAELALDRKTHLAMSTQLKGRVETASRARDGLCTSRSSLSVPTLMPSKARKHRTGNLDEGVEAPRQATASAEKGAAGALPDQVQLFSIDDVRGSSARRDDQHGRSSSPREVNACPPAPRLNDAATLTASSAGYPRSTSSESNRHRDQRSVRGCS